MKVSTLIAWLDDGTLHSVTSETFGPIDELAGVVRRDRTITVGKKSVPVVQAVVISMNAMDARVVKRIMCAAEAKREKLIAEAKAEAVKKAAAEAKK